MQDNIGGAWGEGAAAAERDVVAAAAALRPRQHRHRGRRIALPVLPGAQEPVSWNTITWDLMNKGDFELCLHPHGHVWLWWELLFPCCTTAHQLIDAVP